jgi:hypothetical protein
MDMEISADGTVSVKNVSQVLTQEDVLDIITENFKEDLTPEEEYVIMDVPDPESDMYTDWYLVPKSLMESKKRGLNTV